MTTLKRTRSPSFRKFALPVDDRAPICFKRPTG
jgi:hypothetical protein